MGPFLYPNQLFVSCNLNVFLYFELGIGVNPTPTPTPINVVGSGCRWLDAKSSLS